MFKGYDSRTNDYGHEIAQGEQIRQHLFSVRFSFMLLPLTNTKFFTDFKYRFTESWNNNYQQNMLFSVGLTSNIWDRYSDY